MSKKLNLCLISPFPPPYGGIGNWSKLLSKHLEKKNNIKLNTINTSPKKRVTEGRTLWDRIVKSGINMIKQINKLKKIIRKDKPDVLHITTSGQLSIIRDIVFLWIAKKKNIPTAYHIHFGRIEEISTKNNLEWKLILYAMKLSSKVIAIDKKTYHTVLNNFNNVEIVYIPNPIDITNMPKFKTNTSENFIMYLGWVIKTKGIEELLSAWEDIDKKNWYLKIVGPYNDNYLKSLKNKYTLENVIFEGEKDHKEAMKLLNKSKIFILPSYTEGFPNVVLEAMSLSKPIIATKVGAIPEMLSGCGILINKKNEDDIEVYLNDLIDNEKKRKLLGENAYNKLINNYTIEIIYDKYLQLWCELSNN
jgi:glycosyltransferase involved in cell wall biosynthesis